MTPGESRVFLNREFAEEKKHVCILCDEVIEDDPIVKNDKSYCSECYDLEFK